MPIKPILTNVNENPAYQVLRKSRSLIFLQGPVGPFFDRLIDWVNSHGATVNRVVFSGGDLCDSKSIKKPILFTKTLADWPAFFEEKCRDLQIDAVVLFGQHRPYHLAVIELCIKLDIRLIVLEEGYFRPGFFTMELDGVNAWSTSLEKYFWTGSNELLSAETTSFFRISINAIWHYLGILRYRSVFPNYKHHRSSNLFTYLFHWSFSWARKLVNLKKNSTQQAFLFETGAFYYFVPFQIEIDSQVVNHSNFNSNLNFANFVLRSFVGNAPSGSFIVFKEHPHDRATRQLKKGLKALAVELNLEDRLVYLLEGNTPDLVKNSRGVVLINSTVGIRAIQHLVPLIALGQAVYNRPEVCFQGTLDDFWIEAQLPNRLVAKAFLSQIKNLTQVSGSLYSPRNTALTWPK